MIESLLNPFLTGFGIYSIILFVFFNKRKSQMFKFIEFDKTVCQLSRIFGLLFLFIFLLKIYLAYQSVVKEMDVPQLDEKYFGTHWFWFWASFIFVIPSQLLWFAKIRVNRMARLLIAVPLITSVEYLVIQLSSIHRDYLPSSWSFSLGSLILSLFWDIILFTLLSFGFYKIKNYLNTLK